MSGIEVRKAVVSSCSDVIGADGQYWKSVEISWKNPEYVPGQYLMVVQKGERWPSPLMIQGKTLGGFTVLIHARSPLAGIQKEDRLTVWGPSGAGLTLEKQYILVSDEAGSLLTRPFFEECRACYVIGEEVREESGVWRDERMIRVETLEALLDPGITAGVDIIAALPLKAVHQWKMKMPSSVIARTKIFTGVKIGCGIGACRGCYIHVEDQPQGIPVCQKGPFLPLEMVEYEKDQNFLMHFI